MTDAPKHTPGPWDRNSPAEYDGFYLDASPNTEAGAGGFRYYTVWANKPHPVAFIPESDDHALADRNLVYAAPALLAACKSMIEAYWRGSEDSDDEHAPFMVKEALTAIAKATGAE